CRCAGTDVGEIATALAADCSASSPCPPKRTRIVESNRCNCGLRGQRSRHWRSWSAACWFLPEANSDAARDTQPRQPGSSWDACVGDELLVLAEAAMSVPIAKQSATASGANSRFFAWLRMTSSSDPIL